MGSMRPTASSPITHPLSPHGVVRRLLRDRDVVGVALAEAGGGDADELRPLLERLDGLAAAVAHRGAEAADHLVDDLVEAALVGHAALDPLGHELPEVVLGVLEVAVLRAGLHGAERAHPAVVLVAAAL